MSDAKQEIGLKVGIIELFEQQNLEPDQLRKLRALAGSIASAPVPPAVDQTMPANPQRRRWLALAPALPDAGPVPCRDCRTGMADPRL